MKFFTNVKSTGNGYSAPFNCCTKLEYVNTDNFTYVSGNTSNVGTTGSPFQRTKIVELYLPNLISSRAYAFKGWSTNQADATKSALRRVIIGKNFNSFENIYVFSYANYVSYFMYSKTPPTGPTINRDGWGERYIYVPDDAVNDYKAAASLSTWAPYIKPLSEYTGERPWEELYPEELGLV